MTPSLTVDYKYPLKEEGEVTISVAVNPEHSAGEVQVNTFDQAEETQADK